MKLYDSGWFSRLGEPGWDGIRQERPARAPSVGIATRISSSACAAGKWRTAARGEAPRDWLRGEAQENSLGLGWDRWCLRPLANHRCQKEAWKKHNDSLESCTPPEETKLFGAENTFLSDVINQASRRWTGQACFAMTAAWRIWSARTDRRRAMRTRAPRLPSCSCVSRRPTNSRDSSPRPRSYSSGEHSSHKTWIASGTRCVGASVITLESPPAPPSPTKRGDTLRLSSPPNPPGERPLPDRAVPAPRILRQR